MGTLRCLACGDLIRPNARVPDQAYCSREECQRERRKLWQKNKRKTDGAYRENQAAAHEKWLLANPDYWKLYRDRHPDYAESNRLKQRERNSATRLGSIAKMDASSTNFSLNSGTYRISRSDPGDVAKMDAWIVKITVLSMA